MNHWLNRLGRKKYVELLVLVPVAFTSLGYYFSHSYLHEHIRKLLVAQDSDGRTIGISDYMRELINDVWTEVDKCGFPETKDPINLSFHSTVPIKWFTSSTIDPVTFGSTHLRTGLLIGLPNSYNYRTPQDLPDQLFQIDNLSFLRSPQGGAADKLNELEKDPMLIDQHLPPRVRVRTIERDSQEGKDFTESMLLSDNAKKFAIARELYMGDSLRPILIIGSLMISWSTAITSGRGYVQYFKLQKAHVATRYPAYCVAGLFGCGIFYFLSSAVNNYSANRSIERSKALGDDYKLGAEEYFRKQLVRDDILGIKPKMMEI